MTSLHPDPATQSVTVRQAIGKDGWIEYRRDYCCGATLWRRAGFNKPCISLRATMSEWRFSIGGESRRFAMLEVMSSGGYPAGFRFTADPVASWKQIGNSVPPPMMMAIARHLRNAILEDAA
jgi:site-specific DNA-cytosine methylase